MRPHHRDWVVLGLSGIIALLSGLVLLAVAAGTVVAAFTDTFEIYVSDTYFIVAHVHFEALLLLLGLPAGLVLWLAVRSGGRTWSRLRRGEPSSPS